MLPGIVGGKDGLQLSTFQDNAPGIFSVGLVLALYSGLGWLSGMRTALIAVFEEPEKEKPNFVLGKVRDILALLALGSVLIGSVAISGVATKLATPILDFLGLGAGATPAVWVIGLVLGLAANTVLFFTFFRLLAAPNVPTGRCGPGRSSARSASSCSSSSRPTCWPAPRTSPRRRRSASR